LILPAVRSLKPATSEKPALKAQDLMLGRQGKNSHWARFFLALASAFQVKEGLSKQKWMHGMEIVIDVATQL
jgi:hypothetical protein